MSEAGDFIDAGLQRESSWQRADQAQARFGPDVEVYGASVGAVRGTVRDALRRYKNLGRDELTALCSELWAVPVLERRLAAVVLLQSGLAALDNSDLTRIEGFLRSARFPELADPLAVDVVGPLLARLEGHSRSRAEAVLERWLQDPDPWLRRAALLAPLREFRAGRGDWDSFVRQARKSLSAASGGGEDGGGADTGSLIREAVTRVVDDVRRTRPELEF
ncbi:DNA alkylation repair protein [Arthrobacter sp. B3I4]|uniref:DNA alkylation repair protein n=1 Tax=Arthrobacter sp. B3I4 TaxID=3042267 RepID=UPI00278AB82F|nr:DNA alkylation repair protein [Arthrobacter sp. B3I4]MDQ0756248.1 hypothetical protein [Arthrobacter sp. B3I4]